MKHSSARYMHRALALARRGVGLVHPNPMVGAVLVKDGRVVGQGWHCSSGGPHAEIEALQSAGESARGATLYVSLEPCNHYGKTPPCTEALIGAGVTRVEVAMRDPNPQVGGCGIERLREAGVEVSVGLLESQAQELLRPWSHWVTTGRPFVLLKLFFSIDGKSIFPDGSSRWISSPVSRAHTQRLRRYADAVMVSAETVLADDPSLDNRTGQGQQPLRVIVDPKLQVAPSAKVYHSSDAAAKALVLSTSAAPSQERQALEDLGIEVLSFEDGDGEVDLSAALDYLGEQGVQAMVVEASSQFSQTLLKKKLSQRLAVYRVPILIGGELENSAVQGEEGDLPNLRLLWARKVGLDALSMYEIR